MNNCESDVVEIEDRYRITAKIRAALKTELVQRFGVENMRKKKYANILFDTDTFDLRGKEKYYV